MKVPPHQDGIALRQIARSIAGAPKAPRPATTTTTVQATRGTIVAVNADGSMIVNMNGTDVPLQADVSYPVINPQPGDIVEMHSVGQRLVVNGLIKPVPPTPEPVLPVHTFRYSQTFSVLSYPAEGTYYPPFFVPVPAGQKVTLVGVRCLTGGSTDALFDLLRNGEIFGADLEITTTPFTYNYSLAVTDNDAFSIDLKNRPASRMGSMVSWPTPIDITGASISFFFDITV